jgi:galactokinase
MQFIAARGAKPAPTGDDRSGDGSRSTGYNRPSMPPASDSPPPLDPRALAQLLASGLTETAAVGHARRFARLARFFSEWSPSRPARAFFVPGRVELLGKHTDYAGGRSLLCALERGFCLLAAARSDRKIRFFALDSGAAANLTASSASHPAWVRYPASVLRRLRRDFGYDRGVDVAFSSNLPPAAGMSSSSAFIVASYLALTAGQRPPTGLAEHEALAAYLAAAETGVGTHGGSEDHVAILCCRPGHWSRYSFCPTSFEAPVPAPVDYALVLAVSGVAADKAGAAQASYNRASAMARAILAAWNAAQPTPAHTLAAALAADESRLVEAGVRLRRFPPPEFASAELAARLRQFWLESEVYVPAAACAAAAGDWRAFGATVAASQAEADAGLQNQVPETRALVASALSLGAIAASAFGAGFGGSVWALAPAADAPAFAAAWHSDYLAHFAERRGNSLCFLSAAGPAALELSLD